MQKKTFVEFLGPDLVSDETVEVTSRDPKAMAPPSHTVGYRFYDMWQTSVTDGEEEIQLLSDAKNVSPVYLRRARIVHLAHVIEGLPELLRSHFEHLKDTRLVEFYCPECGDVRGLTRLSDQLSIVEEVN